MLGRLAAKDNNEKGPFKPQKDQREKKEDKTEVIVREIIRIRTG